MPTIATNDYLLLADASDSNKILKGPALDTTKTKLWLNQAGEWSAPAAADVSAAPSAGANTIVTVGTVTTGTWNATAIGVAYGGTGVNASNTTKNYVFASPNGSAGAPSFRALVAADLPTVTVAKGGLNKTSIAIYAMLYASAANTYAELAPNTTNTKKFLTMTGTGSAGATPGWNTIAAGDLPKAATNTVGGISVSTGLSVTAAGALSVSYGTAASTALQGNQTLFNLNGSDKTASSAAAFYAPTASGTANHILASGGANIAPSWIATAKGAVYVTAADGALTFGTLGTAYGGTGNTSFTRYGVIYANPATKLVSTSAGTADHVLIGAGSAAPKWTTNATLASATSTTANTDAWDVLTLGNSANVTTTTAHSQGKIVIYSAATTAATITTTTGTNITSLDILGSTSTTKNTAAYSDLILGNSANVNTTTAHSEGRLFLYSAATKAHIIKGTSTTTEYTHYLPNATGWIATGGNGTSTGVGGADQIVYLSTTGVLTAGTSATNANTVSTIIKRDGTDGGFNAGTIVGTKLKEGDNHVVSVVTAQGFSTKAAIADYIAEQGASLEGKGDSRFITIYLSNNLTTSMGGATLFSGWITRQQTYNTDPSVDNIYDFIGFPAVARPDSTIAMPIRIMVHANGSNVVRSYNIVPLCTGTIIETALASSWSANTPSTQSILINYICEDNIIEVGIASTATQEQYDACAEAKILCTTITRGSITLTCYGTVPTVDIPIIITVMG